MADVFISYSRKDIGFARLLHAALKQQQLETWIDWEDIPPSVDWLQEVRTAIEQADTFVFLISPASAASEVCRLEIEHAVANHKRLIPVVVGEGETPAVPAPLTTLNWLFFRDFQDPDRFQAAFEALLAAVRTDYAWLKAHTRLQNQALEWDRRGRENSRLLRGQSLRDVERLTAAGVAKEPPLTDVQQAYVRASQWAVRRQRQQLATAVVAALVLILGLGAAVWRQTQTARMASATALAESNQRATADAQAAVEADNRTTAEAQAAIDVRLRSTAEALAATEASNRATAEANAAVEASVRSTAEAAAALQQATAEAERARAEALRLAQAADALLAGNRTQASLAALLALQSIRQGDTPLAETTLIKSLAILNYVPVIGWSAGAVNAVAYAPDGRTVATAHADGTVQVWDPTTGQPVRILAGHADSVTRVVYSPDGRWLLTASRDGTAKVWDAQTGREVRTLSGHTSWVTDAEFSPDGTRVVTAGGEGAVKLWDPATGQELQTFHGDMFSAILARFTPDGRQILAAALTPAIVNGASGVTAPQALLWDIATGTLVQSYPDSMVSNAVYAPDGRTVWWAMEASGWGSRNVLTGVPDHRWTDTPVNAVAVAADGMLAVTVGGHDQVARWDLATGERRGRLTFAPHDLPADDSQLTSVALAPDGQTVVAGNSAGRLFVWSVNGANASHLWRWPTQPFGTLVVSPDGRRAATDVSLLTTLDGAGTEVPSRHDLWDTVSGGWISSLEALGGREAVYTFSPDSATLLAAATGDPWGRQVLDQFAAATGTRTGSLGDGQQAGWITDLAYAPDGVLVALGGSDGQVGLWDPATGIRVRPLAGSTGRILALAFSPDGRQLLTGGEDQIVRLWNVADGSLAQTFTGHTGFVMAGTFRDARTVATQGLDGTVLVWEAATGQVLQTIAHGLALSPDGRYVVSVAAEGAPAQDWDTVLGTEIRTLEVGTITSAAWVTADPDHPILWLATSAGVAQAWDLGPLALRDLACRSLSRDLTDAERAQYSLTDAGPSCP